MFQVQLQQTLRCVVILMFLTTATLFYIFLRVNNDDGISESKFVGTRALPRTLLMKPDEIAAVQVKQTDFHIQVNTEAVYTLSTANRICDAVQIAFFVDDFTAITKMTRSLKSVLFYRRSPIELHVIILKRNEAMAHTVETLFQTWNLSSFNFNVYTRHWQGDSFPIHSLHTILPKTTSAVIVLNTNVTLNTDIKELWKHFDKMRSAKKLFGLVKNNFAGSNFSTNCQHPPMSQQDQYSAAVMLIDLKALHKIQSMNSAVMGREIINVDEFTELVHKFHYLLPCKWAVHFDHCRNNTSCSAYPHDIGILWIEDALVTEEELQTHDFRSYGFNLNRLWMQLDSSLLQSLKFDCSTVESHSQQVNKVAHTLSKFKTCHKILEEASIVYHTHKYFIGNRYESKDEHDVTLVTQLTTDRLGVFFKLLAHWKGPISASVYCSDYEAWQLAQQFKGLQDRDNIVIHVVYKNGKQFPVNYLRNVALSASSTPFVFLSDCDFLTSYNLYTYLKKAARTLQDANSPKRAMIVPAFESLKYNFKFPTSKFNLLDQCRKGIIQIFHKDWFSGHGPTNYNKWANSKSPYSVKWADYFEPYILVNRNVAHYAEQFFGYGYNKVSQIMEVKASGYEFVVLPGGFVVHSPHTKTVDRVTFIRDEDKVRSCISDLKKDFIRYIHRKYGNDCLKNQPGKTKTYSNITTL